MKWRHVTLAAAGVGAGVTAWALTRGKETYELRGKVVLITGASRGLGLQMAREFGARGARIAICARSENELEAARRDLAERGIAAHAIVCDLTQPDRIAAMVEEAQELMGPIDILVNNAAVIQVGPFDAMTPADFESAMATIFQGALHTILAVLPGMKKRRQGRIVNIASIGGKVSVPHLLPYSCAKAAEVALSEGLRAELAPLGICVVTIVPGLMRTGSHLRASFKGRQAEEYRWFSLGAASPLVSISAERAARAIVRATERGDAEKILSVPANLLARVHGVAPEVTAPILAFLNEHLLPQAGRGVTESKLGRDAAHDIHSRVFDALTSMGRSAASGLNQIARP